MHQLVKTRSLIDGTGSDAMPEAAFLVADGVIQDVGPIAKFASVSPDTEVLDLTDFIVMPGIINSHTHLSIIPGLGNQLGQMRGAAVPKALKSIANMHLDVRSGVTTTRIMGEEHFIDFDIRDAINDGYIEGPRIIASGVPLAASNGHGVALTVSDGVYEVQKNARKNLARGADFLKIFATGGLSTPRPAATACTFSLAEIQAAVEEANRSDTYVAAHAHGGLGVDLCIEGGVRTIEHGAMLDERQIEAIIKKDMWVVATCSILYSPEGIEKTDFNIPAIKEKVLAAREVVRGNLSKVVAAGVNMAIGTDSIHGEMPFEMECMVSFGASNMQALLAATRDGAKACRVDDKLGTIEKGKLADFIALRKNPLDDIRNIRSVERVYKDGRQLLA
jgi:imidazolonepropionase-like amidohydrolase